MKPERLVAPLPIPDQTPTSRREFEQVYGEEVVAQSYRIIQDCVRNTTMGMAIFKERDIIRAAKKMAQGELDDAYLSHPMFEALLQFIFAGMPMIQVDRRNTLTTPEMWNMEQAMIHMAGEKTQEHVLPEDKVDAKIGERTFLSLRQLPEDLRDEVKSIIAARDPKHKGDMVRMCWVMEAAEKLDVEVFGAGLTWNRENSTGLSNAMCASDPEEFLAAIQEFEEAEGDGGAWFQKRTLFIHDGDPPESLKRLQDKAQACSPYPVHFLARSGISDEQVNAVIVCTLVDKRVPVVEGTAGAGKSFTMKSVYECYDEAGYEVMGTAISWTAAKVLGGSTGLADKNCRALQGMLNAMEAAHKAGTDFFTKPTLLIVDEAGMVGTEHMYQLLDYTRKSRWPVKVVLTGDSLQVNPCTAGAALQAIVAIHGTARINTIRRQKQASHRLAVERFSKQRSGEAIYPFYQQEAFQWAKNKEELFQKLVRDFVSYRIANPTHKTLALTLDNESVAELNRRIRSIYKKCGLIEAKEVQLDVTDGRSTWRAGFSVGDEVVMRSNSQDVPTYYIPEDPKVSVLDEKQWELKSVGVFNRNAGKIVAIKRSNNPPGSYDFVVDLGGDEPARVVVNSQRFKAEDRPGMPMVHNFATTIYASQGQTVNKVFLVDSDKIDFRLSYVGMSRHTDSVDVYVNESELHLRIDKMLKRSPSVPIEGIPHDQIEVELGRYTRAEMLQTIALAWGKDSENPTAMIHEMRERGVLKGHTKKTHGPKAHEYAQVKQGRPQDPVMDFVPALNVRYPMVDIAKVLEIDEPTDYSEFTRPSDVEDHRSALPQGSSPLRIKASQVQTPHLHAAPSKPQEGLFNKALSWMQEHLAVAVEVAPSPPPPPSRPVLSSSDKMGSVSGYEPAYQKPHHAFVNLDDLPGMPAAPRKADMSGQEDSVTMAPTSSTLTEIPLLPLAPSIGKVEDGQLIFEHVPQSKGPQGEDMPGASDTFLSKVKGLWWDTGRYQEPRILARNGKGEIVARYRLNGECVVGDGYPPIAFSPKAPHAPIHIVPGPKEWFVLQELYHQRFQDKVDEKPHIIWAARDVDWKPVAENMRKHPVLILRSKWDESQIPWARDVKRELEERWGVNVQVHPPLPEIIPEPTPSRPPLPR